MSRFFSNSFFLYNTLVVVSCPAPGDPWPYFEEGDLVTTTTTKPRSYFVFFQIIFGELLDY